MLIQNNRNKTPITATYLKTRSFSSPQTFYGINQRLDKVIEESIVSPADNEKVRYYYQDINEIKIELYKNNTTKLTFYDLGFENNDIKSFTNIFINSSLRINYFDSNLYNKNLIYQIDIKFQLGDDQTDVYGDLLDVADMPVSFLLNEKNMGYGVIYFKNPIDSLPKNIYSKYYLLSGKDGSATEYVSYFNPLTIENLNSYNYIKHTLYNNSNINYITTNSTNREITQSDDRLTIKMKKLMTL